MLKLKFIILSLIIFSFSKNSVKNLSITISLDKDHYSELENILFSLDIQDKTDGGRIKLHKLNHYQFQVELHDQKSKSIHKFEVHDLYFSNESNYTYSLDSINMEKLIGTLEEGEYECRINLRRKSDSKRIFSIWPESRN